MEEPRVVVGVIEEETALAPRVTQPAVNPFAAAWAGAYAGAEEQLHRAWDKLREQWLRSKFRKSESDETRRSYEAAINLWLDFLTTIRHPDGRPVHPWEVTGYHVEAWQSKLEIDGLAPTTINQRLAACSSFYSYVMNEKALVQGIEISAFMDATGKTRANPFKGNSVQRAKVKPYGKARPLSKAETRRLFEHIDGAKQTPLGSRNYALITVYLLTGYRNREVVGLRWGDIAPNPSQPGSFTIQWKGKGGKREREEFPARAFHAIVHMLQVTGRWNPGGPGHIEDDEFIFRPLVTHGEGNLRNQRPAGDGATENRPMSSKAALRTLRTALRKAGVKDPEGVRIHDLRHTYAKMFHEKVGDLQRLRGRLHHSSLTTTDIYTREVLEDPIDDWSESVYQGMLFQA
jgi:integrase